VFFVGGGIPATSPTVIFRNMAIHNGKAQSGNGGGGMEGNGGNYNTPACAGGGGGLLLGANGGNGNCSSSGSNAGGWGGGACGGINYDGITEYGGSGTLTLKNILFDSNSTIRGTGETNG
jgi:hypothetical protein